MLAILFVEPRIALVSVSVLLLLLLVLISIILPVWTWLAEQQPWDNMLIDAATPTAKPTATRTNVVTATIILVLL